jgi:hypothetical protein
MSRSEILLLLLGLSISLHAATVSALLFVRIGHRHAEIDPRSRLCGGHHIFVVAHYDQHLPITVNADPLLEYPGQSEDPRRDRFRVGATASDSSHPVTHYLRAVETHPTQFGHEGSADRKGSDWRRCRRPRAQWRGAQRIFNVELRGSSCGVSVPFVRIAMHSW